MSGYKLTNFHQHNCTMTLDWSLCYLYKWIYWIRAAPLCDRDWCSQIWLWSGLVLMHWPWSPPWLVDHLRAWARIPITPISAGSLLPSLRLKAVTCKKEILANLSDCNIRMRKSIMIHENTSDSIFNLVLNGMFRL